MLWGHLIGLQGPAPPGTVGWSEKLAKAGILVKVGLSPSLGLWYFWLSHKCSESSQGRQIFQSPCPDLGAQAALATSYLFSQPKRSRTSNISFFLPL